MKKQTVFLFFTILSFFLLTTSAFAQNLEFSWCQAPNNDATFPTGFNLYHGSSETATLTAVAITNFTTNSFGFSKEVILGQANCANTPYYGSVEDIPNSNNNIPDTSSYFKLTALNSAIESEKSTVATLPLIIPVNQAPTIDIAIPNITTPENTPSSLDLTSYANDANNDPLTWTVTGINTALFSASINANTDFLTITPVSNASGNDTIALTVTDSGNLSASQNIIVTITPTPINNAPVARADIYNINEGSILSVLPANGLLKNDDDIDGNNLSTVLVSDVSNGVLNLNSDGSFTYAPNAHIDTQDSFTYQAKETDTPELHTSNTVTVNITINPVNDPPVLTSIPGQTILISESFASIALDNFVNDIDTSDALIQWSTSSNTIPSNLTVSIDQNRIASISSVNPKWSGEEIIKFTASDGEFEVAQTALFKVSKLTITVNPEITILSKNSTEFKVSINVENVEDLKAVNFDLNFNPDIFSVALNQTGSYLITQGDFLSSLRQTAFIPTVANGTVNVAMVLFPSPTSISTGQTGSGVLAEVTFAINGDLSVSGLNLGLTLTDTILENYSSTPRMIHSVKNGAVALNSPPSISASAENVSTNEEQSNTVTLTTRDIDGHSVTITYDTLPLGATFSSSTNTLTFSPSFDFVTPAEGEKIVIVNFTATDSLGASSEILPISFTVAHVNRSPEITSSPVLSVTEGQPYNYPIVASDPDGSPLSYTLTSKPTGMGIDANGLITWNPDFNAADQSPYSIAVRVGDDEVPSGFYVQTFQLSVINSNQIPSFNQIGDFQVNEGKLLSIDISATDPDNDQLTLTAISSLTGFTFIDNGDGTGQFSWLPGLDYCTPTGDCSAKVTFTVTDGNITQPVSTLVTIPVTNVNHPPVIYEQSPSETIVSTMEKESKEFSIMVRDDEGDPLTVTWRINGIEQQETETVMQYTPSYAVANSPFVTQTIEVAVSDGLETTRHSWTLEVENVMDGDGVTDRYIDFNDLFDFISRWQAGDSAVNGDCTQLTDSRYHELYDFDKDCFIGFTDLVAFADVFNSGIKVKKPNGGETISGLYNIIWRAKDPATSPINSALTVDIYYSKNNEKNWAYLGTANGADMQFPWDTNDPANFPDGNEYKIKIKAITNDKNNITFEKTDISDQVFTISNAQATGIANISTLAIDPSEHIFIDITDISDTEIQIDIAINDLSDLHNINFDIEYDKDRLSVDSVTEGELLKTLGDTFFKANEDKINGILTITTALLGTDQGSNEDGILTSIIFTKKSADDTILTSDFKISDLVLRDRNNENVIKLANNNDEPNNNTPTPDVDTPSGAKPAGKKSDSTSSGSACFISEIIQP